MSHTHTMKDTDPSFYIDADLRTIESLSEDPVTLVKGDHNSEVFTFEMDRYIDEHDLKLCNKVEVHYINIDANSSKNRSPGIYTVTDLKVDPEDDKNILFTWTIPITATTYAGALSFIVRFECTEGEEILYAWNTTPCNEVTVLDSIYNDEFIEEEYTDVIGEWYNEILSAKNQALDEIGKSGGIVVSNTEPESDDVNVWVDNSEDEVVMLLEASDCVKMANAVKGTASGEVIILDDVSPLEHAVKAKVRGKNLIPYPYYQENVSVNGGTLTAQSDGGITGSGTPTGSTSLILYYDVPLVDTGTVTFSLSGDYTNMIGVFLLEDSSGNTLYNKTLDPSLTVDLSSYPTATKWELFVKRKSNDVEMTGTIYPQLEIGDTATDYTPYIDPTTVIVTGCGKNLLKSTTISQTVSGVTFTINADGTIIANGTSSEVIYFHLDSALVKTGNTYHCSGCPSTGGSTTYSLAYQHRKGTTAIATSSDIGSGVDIVATDDFDNLHAVLVMQSGVTVSNLYFKPMINLGEGGNFEAYNGSTYTPSSDGLVDVDSVSPNMTVFTDTAGVSIELEYNKDLNKVLANLPSGGGITEEVKQEIVDEVLETIDIPESGSVETDKTLSVEGLPADAKATGDSINDIADALKLKYSRNLFDNTYSGTETVDGLTITYTKGCATDYIADKTTGTIVASSGSHVTYKIPVIEGNTLYGYYTASQTAVKAGVACFYDKNGSFISSVTVAKTTGAVVPTGAKWVRLMSSTAGYKEAFLNNTYPMLTYDSTAGVPYSIYEDPVYYVEDDIARSVLTIGDKESDCTIKSNVVSEYAYSVTMVDSLHKSISDIWEYMRKMHEPTILDSGVCGPTLTWSLYSDGLLKISGTGRSYDYCKGVLIGKTRAEIEAGVADGTYPAEYAFQDGKTYDDTNAQYVSPWYKYRNEPDWSYCTEASYNEHNPNGWKYNRIEVEEGITYLGDWLFYRVSGPTELIIPEGVTELGSWAIRYSPTLKYISLPDSVTTIGYRGCSRNEAATSIHLGTSISSIGNYGLAQNSKVKYLHIVAETLGVQVCAGNAELECVTLENMTEIPSNSFSNCTALKRIEFPDGLTTIGQEAFYNNSFEFIRIPSSVTSIGTSAFTRSNDVSSEVVYVDTSVTLTGTKIYGSYKYYYFAENANVADWVSQNCTKIGEINGYTLYIKD